MSPKHLTRRNAIGVLAGSPVAFSFAPALAREIEGTTFTKFGRALDISGIAAGDWMKLIVAEDFSVFIRRRTIEQIYTVRREAISVLSDPTRDEDRAPDAEWIVVSGHCTHAGCDVVCGLGPFEGWACFCHGSYYDMSGRVRGGPARRNLAVAPYQKDGVWLTFLSA
jgi:ubiquinol-cytochrome c reductase iron-sulfur subunit